MINGTTFIRFLGHDLTHMVFNSIKYINLTHDPTHGP